MHLVDERQRNGLAVSTDPEPELTVDEKLTLAAVYVAAATTTH